MKNKPLGCLTFSLATFAVNVMAADWYAPQEPFPVYGNTYYVGTGGISAVPTTSSAGHVLVDVPSGQRWAIPPLSTPALATDGEYFYFMSEGAGHPFFKHVSKASAKIALSRKYIAPTSVSR